MNLTIASLTRFPKIFTETLNKHASIKKEYVQANQANFATKDLQKAIMLRSWKEKSLQSKKDYNKATLALVWLKKLKKENTFKTWNYLTLLTARCLGQP